MVEHVEQEHKEHPDANKNITPSKLRNTMRQAMGQSTYERYRHRTYGDSDEELTGECAHARYGFSPAFLHSSIYTLDDVSMWLDDRVDSGR